MANSPPGLSTENPVTSSRIKYARAHTHTHRVAERFPHVETLSNQNTGPRTGGRKGGGTPAPGLSCACVLRRSGDPRRGRGRGRGGTARKRTGLSLTHKKNKPGRGRGKARGIPQGEETPRKENNGRLCPRSPRAPRNAAAEAPPAAAAGRQAASLPHPPAPRRLHAGGAPPGERKEEGRKEGREEGRQAGETPERCRRLGQSRAGGRAAEPTSAAAAAAAACACGSRPSCLGPRAAQTPASPAEAGVSGRGSPQSLRVLMPLWPEAASPPPENLLPPSLPGRAGPGSGHSPGPHRRGGSAGRPGGRQSPGAGIPPAARGAQPGPPVSAATGVGGRRKRGTMRWQPCRGLPQQPRQQPGLRAKRQGLSPGQRQKVRPDGQKVTASPPETAFFFFLQINSRGAGGESPSVPCGGRPRWLLLPITSALRQLLFVARPTGKQC